MEKSEEKLVNELNDAVAAVQLQAKEVNKTLTQKMEKITKQKELLDKEMEEMSSKYPIDSSVIDLNVSGQYVTAYKSTLCKFEGSMIAAMFSGRHPYTKDREGRIFIGRPYAPFSVILSWLQTGEWILPEGAALKKAVDIELDYFGLSEFLYALIKYDIPESTILSILEKETIKTLLDFLPNDETIGELLYRGSRDGFNALQFHSLCDNKGKIIAIIRSSTGSIFGGYSDVPWSSAGGYTSSSNNSCFLFSLNGGRCLKFEVNPGDTHAFYFHISYGTTFGRNHDLYIANQSNVNATSYTNLSGSYPNKGENNHILNGGTRNFTVSEIEVFKTT